MLFPIIETFRNGGWIKLKNVYGSRRINFWFSKISEAYYAVKLYVNNSISGSTGDLMIPSAENEIG